MNINSLNIGLEISNEELTKIFDVGIMGGMRKSRKNNRLVLISDPFKGFYTNRWDWNIFFYTGKGKKGDQKLELENKDLANSTNTGLQIYLFEVFKPTKYYYHGLVKYKGNLITEKQKDKEDNLRTVLIFPLEKMTHNYVIELEYLKSKENILDSNIKIKSSNEIIDLLQKYKSKLSGKRIVSSIYFERNTIIKEYVKRRAKGKCELCNENAPFRDSKGIPYLEVYHIVWLSRNSEDSIENTVALCPNCHRKVHLLDNSEDIEKLKAITQTPLDGA